MRAKRVCTFLALCVVCGSGIGTTDMSIGLARIHLRRCCRGLARFRHQRKSHWAVGGGRCLPPRGSFFGADGDVADVLPVLAVLARSPFAAECESLPLLLNRTTIVHIPGSTQAVAERLLRVRVSARVSGGPVRRAGRGRRPRSNHEGL